MYECNPTAKNTCSTCNALSVQFHITLCTGLDINTCQLHLSAMALNAINSTSHWHTPIYFDCGVSTICVGKLKEPPLMRPAPPLSSAQLIWLCYAVVVNKVLHIPQLLLSILLWLVHTLTQDMRVMHPHRQRHECDREKQKIVQLSWGKGRGYCKPKGSTIVGCTVFTCLDGGCYKPPPNYK